ncbi:MAG: hypothetical protein AAFZ11_01190 [Pseudomonadota bacterium]
MLRGLFILGLAIVLGGGAYVVLMDDGVLEQVTAARVEQALLDNRVPAPMAACMAPKLADQLTITQLRELEALAAREAESGVPQNAREALARLAGLQSEESVRTVAEVGTTCTIEVLRSKVDAEFERQKELLGL